MIGLCVEKSPSIIQFHGDAIAHKTNFFINATVRQEFLKSLRKAAIIAGIKECVNNNTGITNRYSAVLGEPFRVARLKNNFEKIYKDHVKNNDVSLILDPALDIASQETGFLNYAQLNYYATSDKDITFDDVANLINLYGMAPSDGTIAAFAFAIEARAIITLDSDFAHLCNYIDVYMPLSSAMQCALYDPNSD